MEDNLIQDDSEKTDLFADLRIQLSFGYEWYDFRRFLAGCEDVFYWVLAILEIVQIVGAGAIEFLFLGQLYGLYLFSAPGGDRKADVVSFH